MLGKSMQELETTKYLRSLKSVRERTRLLLQHPEELNHFDLHLDNLPNVASFIVNLIQRDYSSPEAIPPHTRWRHFNVGGKDRMTALMSSWKDNEGVSNEEVVCRLLDLFLVSVLLDAGAGNSWKYSPRQEPNQYYNRSEGLALASLDYFLEGGFSSSKDHPCRVDATRLASITVQQIEKAFQVSETNPLSGVEGRSQLLQRLGKVLSDQPRFFSSPNGVLRPSNMIHFLRNHPSTKQVEAKTVVPIEAFWEVIMDGISGIWPPTRSKIGQVSLGDVWFCQALKSIQKSDDVGTGLVTFHKLSQWLTYSLLEPLQLLGFEFSGVEQLTGLAEYRNGGLFVDMKVLTMKERSLQCSRKSKDGIPVFEVFDDAVVEWRGLTVALLDKVAELVRQQLGMDAKSLPLAKVLEAGTWKAGREMAAKLRPETKGPPIEIVSDGTVF